MVLKAEKNKKAEFRINPPVFLPFYNEWGENAYYADKAFSYNPFTIKASSTSGSPVLIAGNKFFGFLNECGGTFEFDGMTKLTVTIFEGGELYYSEEGDPYAEWKKYNDIITGGEACEKEEFWTNLEYCTWVEQARVAALSGKGNQEVLCEQFVYDYMERVKKMGLPKGKLTIDDGWAKSLGSDGQYMIGTWEIDREKFPHMEQLVKDIKAEGFIPGLWLTPFTFTKNSELAEKYPYLVGEPHDSYREWYHLICDEDILREYYRKIFTYYAGMGFMKFKLDISYGPKDQMVKLMKLLNEEIKAINPKIEIETHIPDIFASKYSDVIRINDVSICDGKNWQYVTSGHYTVCKNSSPNRILNLDHIGGNNPMVKACNFMTHFDMLKTYAKESESYLVVSMLPDAFSEEIQAEFKDGLYEIYDENGRRVIK